jgi:hypothetical protein
MKKMLLAAMALVLMAVAGGCAVPLEVLATHVTKVAPDTEVDTVWILRGGKMYRCANTASGPVCVAVKDAVAQ